MRRTLGCVRLVYNKALHERTQAWYERRERVGYPETATILTQWKKQEELDFLMVKNHKLALAISDSGWSELIRQLDYKCRWYGRNLVAIDRWFPSSKRYSSCGQIVDKMPLNIREWTCTECGCKLLRI